MTEHDLLRQNWCALTGVRTETTAVYGTLRYLLRQVDPAAFSALQLQLVRGLRLSFVEMIETDKDGNTSTWVWLTSLAVERDNVIEIAQAGRLRWKTENEGNNEQKAGYGIEHFCNCSNYNEMMALYFILQTAMTLMWLLARSNLLDEAPILTHLAFLLLESLRNIRIDIELCDRNKHP